MPHLAIRCIATAAISGTLAACGGPQTERHPMPGADAERGKALILDLGCGVCHVVPGVSWPRGHVGPPLTGFADRALIAGRHPNEPQILIPYLRDASAFTLSGGMPPMPLAEQEARDVAAYLYTLHA